VPSRLTSKGHTVPAGNTSENVTSSSVTTCGGTAKAVAGMVINVNVASSTKDLRMTSPSDCPCRVFPGSRAVVEPERRFRLILSYSNSFLGSVPSTYSAAQPRC